MTDTPRVPRPLYVVIDMHDPDKFEVFGPMERSEAGELAGNITETWGWQNADQVTLDEDGVPIEKPRHVAAVLPLTPPRGRVRQFQVVRTELEIAGDVSHIVMEEDTLDFMLKDPPRDRVQFEVYEGLHRATYTTETTISWQSGGAPL